MSQTYFITGAQGCIGSWIVKALAERGDTPVVFDRSEDARRLNAIMDRVHSNGYALSLVILRMWRRCVQLSKAPVLAA